MTEQRENRIFSYYYTENPITYNYYYTENMNYHDTYLTNINYHTYTNIRREYRRNSSGPMITHTRNRFVHNYENRIYNSSDELSQNIENLREIEQSREALRELFDSYSSELASAIVSLLNPEFDTNVNLNPNLNPNLNENLDEYLKPGDEYNESCSICIEECENGTTSKLSCGHHFHTTCVKEWLKRSRKCPLCRKTCKK